MAVKIPTKLHTMSPTFQKAWYKRNKMDLPAHLTGSAKQASKEVKPSERVKSLQAKSLKAYGATKGAKVGGEYGSGEMKDTIAPLTRDQHSKVQAAARAAKAAQKLVAAKKTPLTKDQRFAAIAAAVRKAQSKHDVPTMEPDDEGHDDLRDVHQSLHIRKGAYSEAVDRMAIIKQMAAKNKMNKPVALTKKPETVKKSISTHKHYAFFSDLDYSDKDKKQGSNRFEEVTHISENSMKDKIDPKDLPFTPDKKRVRRGPGGPMSQAKWLAKQAMMKKMKEMQKEEVVAEAVKDAADVGEYDYEGDMTKSQLRSILFNAKRMHDMLEDNTNLPEWVQSKVTLAEDYISTAANYMQGEMNEEALDELAASLDEEIELFEKAPPGSKYERMVKHIKKGYAKDGLTPQEKSIAYATAWKAHNKANEEVEQTDEAIRVTMANRQLPPKSKRRVAGGAPTKSDMRRDVAAAAAKEKRSMYGHKGLPMGGINALNVLMPKNVKKGQETWFVGAKKTNEEVEQMDEAIRGYIQSEPGNEDGTAVRRPADQAERDHLARNLIANRKYNTGKKIGRKSGSVRSNAAGMTPSQKISTALRSPEASKKLDPKEFPYMPKNAKITPFLSKEEVEQIDELDRKTRVSYLKKSLTQLNNIASSRHTSGDKTYGSKTVKKRLAGLSRLEKGANQAASVRDNIEKTRARFEEVDVAEGSVPTTPKEKALAAHHGDKTKITYGDVIKARIKSAAAKAMNKGK